MDCNLKLEYRWLLGPRMNPSYAPLKAGTILERIEEPVLGFNGAGSEYQHSSFFGMWE